MKKFTISSQLDLILFFFTYTKSSIGYLIVKSLLVILFSLPVLSLFLVLVILSPISSMFLLFEKLFSSEVLEDFPIFKIFYILILPLWILSLIVVIIASIFSLILAIGLLTEKDPSFNRYLDYLLETPKRKHSVKDYFEYYNDKMDFNKFQNLYSYNDRYL
ncbi:MAG: hypothetical protein WCX96_04235 [Bacilli bacterium]|nr:hypothetical protein [Acholeplasmataceae bacterium]